MKSGTTVRPGSVSRKDDCENDEKKALKALNMVKSNEQVKNPLNQAKTGKALKALIILN